MLPSLGLLHLVRLWPRNVLPRGEPRSTNTLGALKGLQGLREAGPCKLSKVLAAGFSVRPGAVLSSVEGVHYELFGLGGDDEALEGHRHTSQSQSSGWPPARTVRLAHRLDFPSRTRRLTRWASSGVRRRPFADVFSSSSSPPDRPVARSPCKSPSSIGRCSFRPLSPASRWPLASASLSGIGQYRAKASRPLGNPSFAGVSSLSGDGRRDMPKE